MLMDDSIRQCGAEQHAICPEEITRLGELLMGSHEMAGRNTVPICENNIIGVRRCKGAIADRCGTKSFVFLPGMRQQERCTACVVPHDLAGLPLSTRRPPR